MIISFFPDVGVDKERNATLRTRVHRACECGRQRKTCCNKAVRPKTFSIPPRLTKTTIQLKYYGISIYSVNANTATWFLKNVPTPLYGLFNWKQFCRIKRYTLFWLVRISFETPRIHLRTIVSEINVRRSVVSSGMQLNTVHSFYSERLCSSVKKTPVNSEHAFQVGQGRPRLSSQPIEANSFNAGRAFKVTGDVAAAFPWAVLAAALDNHGGD